MASKKRHLIMLELKTDEAKEKISYHGLKWEFLEEIEKRKYSSEVGPFLVLRSLDGSKILFIKKDGDHHFKYRKL